MTRAGSIGSSKIAALVAVLVWTAHAETAFAADSSAKDGIYVSQVSSPVMGDLAPGAEIVGQGRPLSIEEAVALSIRNNLDVEVERFAPMIAESNRIGSWGVYDPTISADMMYDVAKSPNTFSLNSVTTNRERVKGGGVGFDQLIPYVGASVGLRYGASSTSTRSSIQSRDEQYDQSVFLTASIPLARNLVWNQSWTNVKVAESASISAREGFRGALMDSVQTTVNAYWDLAAARDQVRVSQKSLETARALLEQTKTQYEVGVVSRVEVVEAEAGVADREFGVIRNANDYRNAQDRLIDLVLGRQLSAVTKLEFSPTDASGRVEPREVDLANAVALAFEKRPELRQAEEVIEQGEINLRWAKNQRLPQFDVEARMGYLGISGEGNVGLNEFDPATMSFVPGTPPPNVPFDQGDDDWFQGSGSENYRITGVFSIPFPNTTARKRVVSNSLDLRRSKTRRARLEQTVILEVRRAARTLLASAQGIEASERRRLAAEEQLRAERIRLEHGESTPFNVLEREEDLVEAESQKINALQSYRSAEVGLERAQGTILDFHRVVLDEIGEPTR